MPWIEREARRLYGGPRTAVELPGCGPLSAQLVGPAYERVPWFATSWWPGKHVAHFAHVSVDEPSKIAFTQSAMHGERDRQIRMKPGKYLRKYFGGVLTEGEIRHWAERWNAKYDAGTLKVAHTADEIEHVYTSGPHSCMAHAASRFSSPVHPSRVYASGDLAVAYIGAGDDITARAVVWPERKEHSQIYGDDARLAALLGAAGYSFGSLEGAKLVRIEDCGRVVCPYLDEERGVADMGDHLLIDSAGEYLAESTDGYADRRGEHCPCCGERSRGDFTWVTDRDERWCEGCVEQRTWYCDAAEQTFSDDATRYEVFNGSHYVSWSEDAYEDGGAFYCEDCNVHHTKDRYAGGSPGDCAICTTCAEQHDTCDECEARVPSGDLTDDKCDLCQGGRAPRCSSTTELPLHSSA